MHFSWFHLIPALEGYPDHVLTAGLCTLVIVILSLTAYAVAGKPEEALLPDQKLTLKNFFEFITESLCGFVESVMGHGSEKYIPIVGTMFIYILVNNLMGLLPGFSPATDNLNTTLSIGVFVFFLYNTMGFREHGVKYVKHFFGPSIVPMPKSNFILQTVAGVTIFGLGVFFLLIESVSHAVRPMSLGLRLYGNMTGDHTVLSIFLNLVPIGIPMIFYLLGLFVCFVQAFVFSLLSMVYISMATAHDH